MNNLQEFPSDIATSILMDWFITEDLLVFDTALCNRELRKWWTDLTQQDVFVFKVEESAARKDTKGTNMTHWAMKRGVKISSVMINSVLDHVPLNDALTAVLGGAQSISMHFQTTEMVQKANQYFPVTKNCTKVQGLELYASACAIREFANKLGPHVTYIHFNHPKPGESWTLDNVKTFLEVCGANVETLSFPFLIHNKTHMDLFANILTLVPKLKDFRLYAYVQKTPYDAKKELEVYRLVQQQHPKLSQFMFTFPDGYRGGYPSDEILNLAVAFPRSFFDARPCLGNASVTSKDLLRIVKGAGAALEDLNVDQRGSLDGEFVAALGTHCPNLQKVLLRAHQPSPPFPGFMMEGGGGGEGEDRKDVSFCTPEQLILCAEGCRKIKSLDIAEAKNLTDEVLAAFARHCPELERVVIFGAPLLTDATLIALGTHATQLKVLSLRSCTPHLFTPKGWEALFRGCPRLREATLPLTAGVLRGASFSTSLATLTLVTGNIQRERAANTTEDCEKVNSIQKLVLDASAQPAGMSPDMLKDKMLCFCPKLEEIGFKNFRLAIDTLEITAKACPRLRSVLFNDCNGFEEEQKGQGYHAPAQLMTLIKTCSAYHEHKNIGGRQIGIFEERTSVRGVVRGFSDPNDYTRRTLQSIMDRTSDQALKELGQKYIFW